MALWGNRDSKSASGTLVIAANGSVTGYDTEFTTEARIGDTIIVGNEQYVITVIDSDSEVTVTSSAHGKEIVEVSSATSYRLNEKPVFVSQSESQGDSSKVFGVDRYEISEGAGNLTDISIIQGGSNYTEVPNVTVQTGEEGQAYAEATLTDGVVTAITITGNGNFGYSAVPNVYIDVPRRTIPTANVNTTAETIGYEGHGLNTGDTIRYYGDGLAPAVADEFAVFVIKIDADTFKVATSKANAEAGTAINLTSTGNEGQYFDVLEPAGVTATAKAVLGSGTEGEHWEGYSNWVSGEQHVTHTGWVRKTVGTGGRAGRVQYETLVAMGSISGDANDDRAFPED